MGMSEENVFKYKGYAVKKYAEGRYDASFLVHRQKVSLKMKGISNKRIIVIFLLSVLLLGVFVPRYEVSAASKKARYWAQLFGPDFKGDAQNIKSI